MRGGVGNSGGRLAWFGILADSMFGQRGGDQSQQPKSHRLGINL